MHQEPELKPHMHTKLSKEFHLTCTGEPYDGVDTELVAAYKTSAINYPLRPIQFISSTNKSHNQKRFELNPGDIFYYIFDLANLTSNIITNKTKCTNRDETIRLLLRYIIKWLDAQSDKLQLHLHNPNRKFANKELSEFHLSQNHFDKTVDFEITIAILSVLNGVAHHILVEAQEYALLFVLANSALKLEKSLRKCFAGKPPSLAPQKNMPNVTNTLNVLKFELTTAFLYSLINQNEFVLAEAYINKCLTLINTLNKSDWDKLTCVMHALQAHIAAKTNNIDMLLQSLDSTFSSLHNDLESCEALCYLTNLPDSCMLAGQHFEQADRIDIAIKYYLQALRLSGASKKAQEIKTLLTSLNGKFSDHLANFAKEQQFNNILQTVKGYPQASRLDLYFFATEYATLFKAILDKNDISTQYLKNSTTNIAIIVSYKLDPDAFKFALTKTQKQISKKQRAQQLQLKNEPNPISMQPQPNKTLEQKSLEVLGESGRHPKAVTTKSRKIKVEKVLTPNIKLAFSSNAPIKVTAIEFPHSQKTFHPDALTGVVALRIKGTIGTWFACLNPCIIDELEKLKTGEGKKIEQRFNNSQELGNDFAVPCFKEMELKSKQLGADFCYVFKIRFLSKDGMGDVRIYAEILEEVGDKKLVAFTAINPHAHAKHSRPIRFPMPELTLALNHN